MSAQTRERPIDQLGRMRRSFWAWRGQRPFWAGMLTLLAGVPIMYVPYHNLTLGSLSIRMSTTAGAGSLIIGVLLIVLGLTMWFQPQSRVFAGVAAILLALVSLVVSNIGGFLIGFLLGLIGGALGVSWAPPGARTARAEPGDTGKAATAPTPSRGGIGSALDDVSITGDDVSRTGAAPSADTDAAAGSGDPGHTSHHANGRHRAG